MGMKVFKKKVSNLVRVEWTHDLFNFSTYLPKKSPVKTTAHSYILKNLFWEVIPVSKAFTLGIFL